MAHIWVVYGFGMGYCCHIKPMYASVFFSFDSIVFNYGIATYLAQFHRFPIVSGMGMIWIIPYQYHMIPDPSVWECYVFGTVPYNSHIIQAY